MTYCVNCTSDTYHDKQSDQRYHVWSHLTECFPAEPFNGAVATTDRTRRAGGLGRDNEQVAL